ncbi:MAG: hypothetical protein IPI54_12835 [Chitinophagaceae bacterium]|nr:hypothetical protein [Chitinophagaceae bacterium]
MLNFEVQMQDSAIEFAEFFCSTSLFIIPCSLFDIVFPSSFQDTENTVKRGSITWN